VLIIVAAIKAREAAQFSMSGISATPPERTESTIIKSEVALSSYSADNSLSSPSLLFAPANDKFTPTTQLSNPSMGQQKVSLALAT